MFIHKDGSISGREVLITWGGGLKTAIKFLFTNRMPYNQGVLI